MKIYERANRANDRAARLEAKQGHPNRKALLFRHRQFDFEGNATVVEDTLIDPPPIITTPSPRLVGLTVGNDDTGLTISTNDAIAEISRSVPYDLFVRSDGARPKVFIAPPLNPDGSVAYTDDALKTIDGRWAFVVHVDDRDCCVWKVILRRERDR